MYASSRASGSVWLCEGVEGAGCTSSMTGLPFNALGPMVYTNSNAKQSDTSSTIFEQALCPSQIQSPKPSRAPYGAYSAVQTACTRMRERRGVDTVR